MGKKTKGFSRHALASGLSAKEFQLILFPTEQCNFRCVYCYEDFEKGKMPEWLVNSIKIFIANKIQNLDKLTLSWFGGEPLLAEDVVFEIAEYANELANKYGCKLTGDLTTNGSLLTLKTLKRLVALKQDFFQISIDGDKESHDQTRVTRSGHGSFDKVWTRLVDAAGTNLDFNILLRIHVTDVNQDSVLNFCKRYDESLASDPRFKLYFKAIENLGGNNVDKIGKLIGKRSAREFADMLTRKYEQKSVDLQKNGHYICYASKPNSLAIRSDGLLNKCTVALKDDVNAVGKINPDGTLEINNQRFSTWLKGFTTLDSWQMGCPLSYMNNNSSVGDIQFKKVG
ncbi:radical SAM protein [Pseudoalteromonas sp. NBT06-2]|uniref:radical SAM protein n=1 Tax=Pseudoalteromonas sp. NBT06-2 TaxID=2025950 RepID=UPI000BA5B210|nr:radical SAM protein [Pseudoalteromonas sp. NBT06-2]PAJ75945.1 radical SAM protein [Pseudoalteromonas sp. NBT06-2]